MPFLPADDGLACAMRRDLRSDNGVRGSVLG
jgi:hypothetical protein